MVGVLHTRVLVHHASGSAVTVAPLRFDVTLRPGGNLLQSCGARVSKVARSARASWWVDVDRKMRVARCSAVESAERGVEDGGEV
jgi:hypothetical protein